MEPWKKSALYSFLTFLITAIIIASSSTGVLLMPWYTMEEETTVTDSYGDTVSHNESAKNGDPNSVWDRDGRRMTGDIAVTPRSDQVRTYNEEREQAEQDDDYVTFSDDVEDSMVTGSYLVLVVAAFSLLTFIVTLLVGKKKLVREIGNIFTYILVVMTLLPVLYVMLFADGTALNNPADFFFTSFSEPPVEDEYSTTTVEGRGYASLGYYFIVLTVGTSLIAMAALRRQYTGVRFTQKNLDTIFNRDGTLKDLSTRGSKHRRKPVRKEYDKPLSLMVVSIVLLLILVLGSFTALIMLPVHSDQSTSSSTGSEVTEYRNHGLTGVWYDGSGGVYSDSGTTHSAGFTDTIRLLDKSKYAPYDEFEDAAVATPGAEMEYKDDNTGETYTESENRIDSYTYAFYLVTGSFIFSLIGVIMIAINRQGSGPQPVTPIIVLVSALLAICAPVVILFLDTDSSGGVSFFYDSSDSDSGSYTGFASLGFYFMLFAALLNLGAFISVRSAGNVKKKQMTTLDGQKVTKHDLSKRNVHLTDVLTGVSKKKKKGSEDQDQTQASSPDSSVNSVNPSGSGGIDGSMPLITEPEPLAPGVLQGSDPLQQSVTSGGSSVQSAAHIDPQMQGSVPPMPVPAAQHPVAPVPGPVPPTTSDSVHIQCPTCSASINVQRSGSSMEVICPACGTKGTIQ